MIVDGKDESRKFCELLGDLNVLEVLPSEVSPRGHKPHK